ncbi:NEDD4 family-interacting protein 1-like [Lytechinus variegatus]|uniref:NEDD4 family-interacting protein 1-like n=1 Tax=Lytechinus variegatus TaxID=7654 RepID=UPI001BB155D8|nr:NEDD4 family-interacting protein 1-like [Lytechinus variegatus]
MENPPSYDEICRTERDSRAQQVTLTLVLPSESEEQNQDNDQSKGNENTVIEPPPYEVPSEPPPKYTENESESKVNDQGLLTDRAADSNSKLGADMIFTLSFIIAFIFNWIGFIFAYCLSMSMAGRFGALSGFGASMVKWSIIAMNSQCCSEYLKSAACLLVALILCGFLIFVRGIYLHIKYKSQNPNGENGNKPMYIVYHRM